MVIDRNQASVVIDAQLTKNVCVRASQVPRQVLQNDKIEVALFNETLSFGHFFPIEFLPASLAAYSRPFNGTIETFLNPLADQLKLVIIASWVLVNGADPSDGDRTERFAILRSKFGIKKNSGHC
jgi:hypothetical protein